MGFSHFWVNTIEIDQYSSSLKEILESSSTKVNANLLIGRSPKKLICLKQSSARMVPKKLGIPNVAAQRIHRLVTRNIHHFEDGRPVARG
jgi:hypothetical protein